MDPTQNASHVVATMTARLTMTTSRYTRSLKRSILAEQRDNPMKPRIDIPHEALAALSARWQVAELALFGSFLRPDFGPASDIDILVRFRPEASHTLLDLAEMEHEFGIAFGRKADLVERATVERSSKYIGRRAILGTVKTIYAASYAGLTPLPTSAVRG